MVKITHTIKVILSALLFLLLSTSGISQIPDTPIITYSDTQVNVHPGLVASVEPETSCLVTMWNHRRDLDITDLVDELGFNLIWSHDDAYSGQAWEDTHMYRLLQILGVDFKVEKSTNLNIQFLELQ